jgi:hypothetical protein
VINGTVTRREHGIPANATPKGKNPIASFRESAMRQMSGLLTKSSLEGFENWPA